MTIRIMVMGPPPSGKTQLILQYTNYDLELRKDRVPTLGIENFKRDYESKEGHKIKLVLFDSPGQERF